MNHLKKISGYLIVFVMLGLIPTSCEDPLDRDSVSSFTEKSVFEDIHLTKAYLGECYMNIAPSSGGTVFGMTLLQLGNITDELSEIHITGNYAWGKGFMTSSDMGVWDWGIFAWLTWGPLYDNIKNVNVLLANIDNVPAETSQEEELKQRMKAEAYFIRAFDYTNLLRSYGGVVLLDEPVELTQDFSTYTRSSLKETMDFILSDIDKAIAGLPQKDGIEQGRATQGAAAALKLRLLLFCGSELVNGGYESGNSLVSFQDGAQQQRLEAARDVGKAFIDGTYGSYSLTGTTEDPPANMTEEEIWAYADNFKSIFLQKGAWNDETIFGSQYLQDQGIEAPINLYHGPCGYHNWGTNGPQERFVRSFEMADGSKFIWDEYDPGNDLVREATAAELQANPLLNPYNGREPRFYASVLYHGAPWQPRTEDVDEPDTIQTGYFVVAGGDYTNEDDVTPGVDTRQSYIEPWNGTQTGYYLRKYLDPDIEGQYFLNEQAGIEFRYAEILLNYAEACIELGELQTGLDALNMVRNRAGLPDRVVTDQTEAREFYRQERKIELFVEGDNRWCDIRRWMIADDVRNNVHTIKVYEWEDGQMRFEWDQSVMVDDRTWNDRLWWLPISYEELQRAPQLVQNPGY